MRKWKWPNANFDKFGGVVLEFGTYCWFRYAAGCATVTLTLLRTKSKGIEINVAGHGCLDCYAPRGVWSPCEQIFCDPYNIFSLRSDNCCITFYIALLDAQRLFKVGTFHGDGLGFWRIDPCRPLRVGDKFTKNFNFKSLDVVWAFAFAAGCR